jgi:hypothetical protein
MPNTREDLRNAAATHGWDVTEFHALGDRFTRDQMRVSVRFSTKGAIVVADQAALSARSAEEIPGPGRAAKVKTILTAPPSTDQA